MNADSNAGYRLQLFRKDATPAGRRRQVFWFIYFVVVFLAQVWPVYTLANRVYPLVLGMPFSMFWVAMWIVLNFVGLVIMYRQEQRGEFR